MADLIAIVIGVSGSFLLGYTLGRDRAETDHALRKGKKR